MKIRREGMLVAEQLSPRHESGRNLEIFSKPPNEDIDTWGAVIRGECLEIRPQRPSENDPTKGP